MTVRFDCFSLIKLNNSVFKFASASFQKSHDVTDVCGDSCCCSSLPDQLVACQSVYLLCRLNEGAAVCHVSVSCYDICLTACASNTLESCARVVSPHCAKWSYRRRVAIRKTYLCSQNRTANIVCAAGPEGGK